MSCAVCHPQTAGICRWVHMLVFVYVILSKRLACCLSPLNAVNLRICACACMHDLVCHTDFTERHVLYVTPERCESADVCVCVRRGEGGEVGERVTERDRQKTSRAVCYARSCTRTRTLKLTRTHSLTQASTYENSKGPPINTHTHLHTRDLFCRRECKRFINPNPHQQQFPISNKPCHTRFAKCSPINTHTHTHTQKPSKFALTSTSVSTSIPTSTSHSPTNSPF